jgi:hypothetical protein
VKKIVLVLVLACVVFVLAACNSNTVNKSGDFSESGTDYGFTRIESGSRLSIYREDRSDVMYVCYHAGFKGGITVMLSEDGSALTYSEWIKLGKE